MTLVLGPFRKAPRPKSLESQWIRMVLPIFVAVCPNATGRADTELTCTSCHRPQAEELGRSVHRSLTCQECHQGAKAYQLPDDQAAALTGRAAGQAMLFDHGTLFRGRLARKDNPSLCGDCHADVVRMNPFGLRTDQLARYWTSRHGKTLRDKGDDRVAVCIDCHGTHEIRPGLQSGSRTHPLNVPETCAACHADEKLMGDYDLPTQVVDEYRQSVHGVLLLEHGDTGAPTCATCHGNHSAMPPGYASVADVCGLCHQHVTNFFNQSIHAEQAEHHGCVQCHGGGQDRHFHLIQRITQQPGVMIQRYAHLLAAEGQPTPTQVAEAIHADPRRIMTQALPTCLECHEEIEDDESLPKLFELLDEIALAEKKYVETANRLSKVGQGVLLVDKQQFLFEEAKTHLIALAPLQHTLSNERVAEKVEELNAICDQVDQELTELEDGLKLRYKALLPIWIFSALMAVAFYAKYKQLRAIYVKPLSPDHDNQGAPSK